VTEKQQDDEDGKHEPARGPMVAKVHHRKRPYRPLNPMSRQAVYLPPRALEPLVNHVMAIAMTCVLISLQPRPAGHCFTGHRTLNLTFSRTDCGTHRTKRARSP
jgi:hypothetical protein